MRRCTWGITPHPAETAMRWYGDYVPACWRHRAQVELMVLESRRMVRMFEDSMARVVGVLSTSAEEVAAYDETWSRMVAATWTIR